MRTLTRWLGWGLPLVLALMLAACEEGAGTAANDLGDTRRDASDEGFDGGVDEDRDGYPRGTESGFDCNDGDPRIHPGAPEVCDDRGVDEDCEPCTVSGWVVRMGSLVNDGDRDGDGHWRTTCTNPAPDVGMGCDERRDRVERRGANFVGMDCDDNNDAGYRECPGCDAGAPCTTICDSNGVTQCDMNNPMAAGVCRAQEVCNRCDDDGDGQEDEGLCAPRSCSVCGRSGFRVCNVRCELSQGCQTGNLPSYETHLPADHELMRPSSMRFGGLVDRDHSVWFNVPHSCCPPNPSGEFVLAYGPGIVLAAGDYELMIHGSTRRGTLSWKVFMGRSAETAREITVIPEASSFAEESEWRSAVFTVPSTFMCQRMYVRVVGYGEGHNATLPDAVVRFRGIQLRTPEEYETFLE